MSQDMAFINEKIKQESQIIEKILAEMEKVIVGQRTLLERMMIAMITSGHILLEGVPGLAKTLSIKTLSSVLDLKFSRIQFTPDLLPADLTGTLVFNPKTADFHTRKGPIFANLLLADEINRAPAKVQSALLEAMQELQVTIGENSHAIEHPFMVMATQNPIEQEGTYPLPEALFISSASSRLVFTKSEGHIPNQGRGKSHCGTYDHRSIPGSKICVLQSRAGQD